VTPALRLILTADASQAKRLRNELRAWLRDARINGATGHDVTLAVDEAFINAVEHPVDRSSREITVSGEVRSGRLVVRIADRGRWQASVDPDRPHYGRKLMDKLMDRVEIERHRGGTTITLHKIIPA
jgi:anti-sigma regulatory factor (Ser/Thr protein kinase)